MKQGTCFLTALLMYIMVFVCAPYGFAQGDQGAVAGVIRDETGAVLPGATINVRNLETEISNSTVSDLQGRFEFLLLPAGEYELQAILPGFSGWARPITIEAAASATLNITLDISAFTETVKVTRTDQDRSAVPMAVSVIGRDEIQFAQRQEALAETLRGIPGLFVENRRNFSLAGGVQATIRAPMVGFGMRGIQLLQDGIPLTTADGTTQPTNLDLGAAGRLEVIRGPNSVLYGNAAGGVINIRTEFPSSDPFWIEPDIQFGSHKYRRQQVKGHGTSGRFSYLFNVNRVETEGFREHSAAKVRRANFVMRVELSPSTEIRGMFNLFDMPFGESASTVNEADALQKPQSVRNLAITQGWGEDATQGQGGVTLEHRFSNGDVFRGTGWGTWRDLWNPIPFRIIDLGRAASGFRSEYVGAREIGTLPITWTTGFDVSYQRDARAEYRNAGVPSGGTRTQQGDLILQQLEEVRSLAPFAQMTLTFHPRWLATAGVRYDYYDFSATDRFLSDGDQSGSRTLDALSPMLGLTFVASDEFNLYTNFSTAYQTPTTVELSNRPTGEGGFNKDLNPEDLRNFEVGARGTVGEGRVRYELAAYFATLDNAFVELQRADEQTFFRNAAKSSRNGLEARIDWTPFSRTNTYLSYTHQDFTFTRFQAGTTDYSGNMEPGAPPNQLFLGGSYETDFGLRAIGQFRWVDAYPVNNANTASNWSYKVVDVRLGWDTKWNDVLVRPFFGIDNIFGERYNASTIPNAFGRRYYEPAPGREVYIGFRIGAGL
jgi:iron complex outermembrane receptor protein